jgi:hypothetical protein
MTKRVTIKAEGRTASDYYAAKLARFQTDQARSKERNLKRQHEKQRLYQRRYRVRLKRQAKAELKLLLKEARRVVNEAVASKKAARLKIKTDRMAAAQAAVELTRLKNEEQRRAWLEAGQIPDGVRRAILREKLRAEAERFKQGR